MTKYSSSLVLAAAFSASIAEAALETDVRLGIDERRPGQPLNQVFSDQQQSFSEDALQVGDSIARPSGYVTPDVAARARPGFLAAGVNAESNTPGESAFESNGFAEARWTARPIIEIPGVAAGTLGMASARMRFRGTVGYSNNGYDAGTFYNGAGLAGLNLSVAGVNGNDTFTALYVDPINDSNNRQFRVTANRTGDPIWFPVVEPVPGTSDSYGWNRDFAIRFAFRTGEPFDIDAFVITTGRAAGGPGRLNWDSAGVAWWRGLVNVEIGGFPVTNFSAVDQFTGLQLGGPVAVPLPGALVLAASGLLALAGWRRSCPSRPT